MKYGLHFKNLHKICPENDTVAKYIDVDSSHSFCGIEDETLIHLFVLHIGIIFI